MASATFRISRDTPALYITAVTTDRLSVFRTNALSDLCCVALNEARTSGELFLFSYVLMPDHLHIIVAGKGKKPSEVLRYVKGMTAHRLIDFLKEHNYASSLDKLRRAASDRNYRHSVWQPRSNVLLVTSESLFMQKVNYIHQNPVRASLAGRARDYRWSSVRCWEGCELEDEPLRVDHRLIDWRR